MKRAMFDPSKELAYIPLDQESNTENISLLYPTVTRIITIRVFSVFKLSRLYKRKTNESVEYIAIEKGKA